MFIKIFNNVTAYINYHGSGWVDLSFRVKSHSHSRIQSPLWKYNHKPSVQPFPSPIFSSNTSFLQLLLRFEDFIDVHNVFWCDPPSMLFLSIPTLSTLSPSNSMFLTHRVLWMLPMCAWVWGQPLEHGQLLREHISEETGLPFTSIHQLPIVPSYRGGAS